MEKKLYENDSKDNKKVIDDLRGQIKYYEAEIERLEEEMFLPGAETTIISQEIESINREINDCKEKLRGLEEPVKAAESVVEKIQSEIENIADVGKKTAKLLGKKLSKLKDEYTQKIRQYASQHKEAIIKKSNEVAKKSVKNGKNKAKIGDIILAVAAVGVVGAAIGVGIKTDKAGTIDGKPVIEEDVGEHEQVGPKEEVKPRYVLNRDNMYVAYDVDNDYGYINFRDNPTTGDNSNVLCQVREGDTLYVKAVTPEVVDIEVEDGHDWRECIVFDQESEQQLNGYVDANLLAERTGEEASAIFKDEDIEVVVDDSRDIDDSKEIQLDAYAVDVTGLNVRSAPSTESGEIITTLGDGDVVYSYSDIEQDNDDPDHDWKHVMYSDKGIYRTCFLDGSYLTAKESAIKIGSDFTESTQDEQQPSTEVETENESQVDIVSELETESESIENIEETTIQDTYDAVEDDVKQFSAYPGYVEYLSEIKRQHPNWVFQMWETGQDFNACVNKHLVNNAVAVEKNGAWSDEWFYNNGNGNVYVDTPNWYTASEGCIAAMMDPRNFLNEVQLFQFEVPDRTGENVTLDDVKKVFSNVGWANAEQFSYMDTNQNIVTLDKSFAELVYDVCKEHNFNPLLAASSIVTEQGNGDTPASMTGKGTIPGYEGLYNYGNVGAFLYAYDGVASAGECGLIRARAEGWTSPEAAIAGYVEHEISSFIDNGKDCKYLKKFDITGNGSYVYMTSFAGAYNEAKIVYQGSNLDQVHVFKIPVFENMPENLCPLPAEPGMYMDNFNGGVATRDNSQVFVQNDELER